MSDVETLQAEIRVLSARATNMKMSLHDLAEELPINWQTIMSVAQQTLRCLQGARGGARGIEGSKLQGGLRFIGRNTAYAEEGHHVQHP